MAVAMAPTRHMMQKEDTERHPARKKKQRPAYVVPKPQNKTVEHKPSADFVPSDTSAFKRRAKKWNTRNLVFGEVTKMEGSAHNPIATVKI